MKYKELYISAQQRFAKELYDLKGKFSDIRAISGEVEQTLHGRRDELSSELYETIMDKLLKIDRMCFELTKF